MDDSLVSEGTRARQRAASQLAGVARFPPATGASDAAMALDESRDAPSCLARQRASGASAISTRAPTSRRPRGAEVGACAPASARGRTERARFGRRVREERHPRSGASNRASVDGVEASQGRGARARGARTTTCPSAGVAVAHHADRGTACASSWRCSPAGTRSDSARAATPTTTSRRAALTPPTRRDEALRGDEDGRTRDLSADVADLVAARVGE